MENLTIDKEKRIKRNDILVFNPQLADQLIGLGHNIKHIIPHYKYPGSSVFAFDRNDENIKEDIIRIADSYGINIDPDRL